MRTCGAETRHFCGQQWCATNVPVGKDSEVFCNSPHPDSVYDETAGKDLPIARCRRLLGHDGSHSAHTFDITSRTEWAVSA